MYIRKDFLDNFSRELLPVIELKTRDYLKSLEGTSKAWGAVQLKKV
jgi:hypothetical protein